MGPQTGSVTNGTPKGSRHNAFCRYMQPSLSTTPTHPVLRWQALGPCEAMGRWRIALLEAECLLALEGEAEPAAAAPGPHPEAVGLLPRWGTPMPVAVSQEAVGFQVQTQVWEN